MSRPQELLPICVPALRSLRIRKKLICSACWTKWKGSGELAAYLRKQLVSIRKIVQVEPISECEKCMEFADRVFESDPSKRSEIAISFLSHVVSEHTGEVLALLAEKYGPVFLNRRSLR